MNKDKHIYIKMYNHEKGNIIERLVEDVIEMIILSQCPIEFNIEALKANAIIARTNLIRKMKLFGGEGSLYHENCDICDGEHYLGENILQKYKALSEKNLNKLEKAINDTKNLIITVNNKPIDARFHDTCGGSTENSENVIGTKTFYLRRVLCNYCKDSPNWQNEIEMDIKEISERLDTRFPYMNATENIRINNFVQDIKRDLLGRVASIKIGDSKFNGIDFKNKLDIDSTRFSIAPERLKIRTRGKGDGLGLCQWGANEMANLGKSYKQILEYYYTGIEIKEIDKPCINQPLKGRILMIDPGHGGNSSQDVIGIDGTREKDIVLDIAKLLKNQLEEAGAKVILTREVDEYVPLSQRVKTANEIRPNFFISLHLNSYHNSSIHGCEIYHYKNDRDSVNLALRIMKILSKDTDIIDRGIKIADFFILREIGVSSLHIEVEYLTNPDREKRLKDKKFLQNISKSITKGIIEYYKY
ncbi:N-acetylmuramoyl-L-alanine amidase [Clostridium sp. D2Q-11]|uniref:N-acetylmuramoyl-L-alanine amidase n=1 Tax=Anaeromonas frigoriresistens TaxID=2683708 RepID=A0A942UR42_9FIRM|nr:N-acetylmuramoyl-L-alanine amidase [Anaeromonas frigoriresistens]MBS4537028.1 N-acetylmuramoyl-L-alanine amidase [Anaeromonas frigoriresistens]